MKHGVVIEEPSLVSRPTDVRRSLSCSLACALAVACGSSSTPPPNNSNNGTRNEPPPSNAAGACSGVPNGPFAQVVKGPRVARGTGGVIADGTYDLVYVVVDEIDRRPEHAMGPIRWQLTFTTEQRDAVHQEGQLVWMTSVPPANDCTVGRFAVVNEQLRVLNPKLGLDTVAFSLTSDGFVMISPGGGSLDPKSYVFRRR